MRTIWKYSVPALSLEDITDVYMQDGAELLSVRAAYPFFYIWAVVDPDAEVRARRFRIAGTGHPFDMAEEGIDVPATFVGTIFFDAPELVFHIFDLGQVRQ